MHNFHHIEYLPTGELFAEQRDYWHTPYRFNGKELDEETGLYYYGARYYTPEVGIWLSVDPLSDKYPSMSAFMYCAGNPVVLVDPDGMELALADIWVRTEEGTYLYDSRVKSQKDAVKRYGENSQALGGITYSFNSKFCKVILGEKGVFSVDGEVGEYPDRAKGFSKGWASFKSIVSKIGEEGSHDGALTGKIDEQDLAVGLGIAGAMTGVGVLAGGVGVGAGILTGLGVVNNIDDAFTNSEGKSGLQQLSGNERTSKTVGDVKSLIRYSNLASGAVNPKDILKSPSKTVNTVLDFIPSKPKTSKLNNRRNGKSK
ncbi:MAG: RHS repeat-associated core domain-containing protein [Bacteroidales bacterium]